MLSLFRNNQSTTVFLLAIYTLCLHLPALIGWVQPQEKLGEGDGGLLFQTIFGWADKNAFISASLATVFVYVQALLVNRLADFYRMMDDRNWLPGALYVLAASSVPDLLFLSPALVAATFIPIALHRTFSVYRQTQAYAAIFDGAFWTMITVFFHPPAFWCIGMVYLAYFSLRSFSPREQFVLLTGILTPTILALAGYFWIDQADDFLRMQFSRFIFWPAFDLPGDLYGSLKITLVGLLLVACLLGFNIYYHKRLIQVQKYVTILYWFCFAGLLATLFQYDLRPESLMLVMPTMGIFLGYLFQSTRNTALLELFHLTLFVTVLLLQFFPKL